MSLFPSPLQFILLLFVVVMLFNIIIFVHELGHFLAGKWRGLHIDRFQIWFGKPIWKKEFRGVQYGLGWIPAGGFVSLPQMAPMASIEGEDLDRKPLPPITPLDKIIVAFAGPLFSILLALVAGVAVWAIGKPKDFQPTTTIGYVLENSPAAKAGILPGDQILAINGEKVNGFRGSLDSISEKIILSSGDKINFSVQRSGIDAPIQITSQFETPKTKWFQRSGLRQVGIAPAGIAYVNGVIENSPAAQVGLGKGDVILSVNGKDLFSPIQLSQVIQNQPLQKILLSVKKASGELKDLEILPVIPTVPQGSKAMIGVEWDPTQDIDVRIVHPSPLEQVVDSLTMMWVTITKVTDPKSGIGIDHLSGPVGIGQVLYDLLQTENGWRRILGFLVLFNVNLAVMNMLPFPVLDGGHITMALLEMIFRKPVNTKALEILQTACALGLMSLMLYITSKDIGDKVGTGSSKDQKVVFPEQN